VENEERRNRQSKNCLNNLMGGMDCLDRTNFLKDLSDEKAKKEA